MENITSSSPMKAIVKKFHSEPSSHDGCSYSFSFVRQDGSTFLHSSRYKSKDSALKGIRAVKKSCQNDNRYVIDSSSEGQHSFKIKAANGVIIVDSVSYSSEQEMQEVVGLIKMHLPECDVDFQKTPSTC